ncbi:MULTISPECIES: FAD binding domain-containing protein [Streptomycetaceae]|uniref:Molybdopterin dehydrogenase FAD-binding protein n=1 Tax=Streptantibioticus cattleyicolor (strain ATCC 35852 / DSM 46488 / JCM 4925 / NBRC 14057 / NRRL 8057) TaxID=1003195 RepID=F8JRM3_STREN|nr:xanthine dehydrogenase family protein subunit M [Streptantibioticus cattleyicolor]AEW97910.1 molybdopterin dehydrogenase FAD-binding protein [Streptantibioticus cattleyicolor NRRL 8057 = DSM 46488]MYS62314.1 xanthine dehydrogenase family protein subunit M [Streptomyces sp. SID5468]CCB78224.1 putative oxidoreductase with FAD-binding domain [Streptantibioticus cattleyicolor NRRL 8057 = DSM 46488]
MKPFRYERAADPRSAVALLADEPDARFLGGGTNLVDLMKLGVEVPGLLVDVSRLPLDRVEPTGSGGLLIGATVRNSDLAAHPLVRERYHVLSQALLSGASAQLRNTATIGGNLLQRTRCVYFQDVAKPCNKRVPGSGCPAREGEHRDLAVLGASEHCVATHPGDMAVALAALDAEVHVLSAEGSRRIPVTELHRLPGDEPRRDTVLRHGELITAVELPPPLPGARGAYRKARDRASYAFALASVAALLEVRDGAVHDVRLVLGALAAKPWRARTAEQTLVGGPAVETAFRHAVAGELAAAEPLRDNGYKVAMAANLAVRVLADLAGGNGTEGIR